MKGCRSYFLVCRTESFHILLHMQETQVSNSASCTVDTGFKCSSPAGDSGFKFLLRAQVFWLRHLITFFSLLRVRISTVGHETSHAVSNNGVPKTNNKLEATSFKRSTNLETKRLNKFHLSVAIFRFTKIQTRIEKIPNFLLFRRPWTNYPIHSRNEFFDLNFISISYFYLFLSLITCRLVYYCNN